MVLGFCCYLSLVFVFSIFLVSVVSNPVRNDTGVPYVTDRNWERNESSIHTPTQNGIPKVVIRQICKQNNHSFLSTSSNCSTLTLEAFVSNKEKNESKPTQIRLSCHHDKGLQSGMLEADCEIVVAFSGIDQSAISGWCQISRPSEKPRSHESSNKSFQNFTIDLNITKEECGRRLGANHTRQLTVNNRLYQVQLLIQRGLCVKMPKQIEKLAKCCNDISVLCLYPTSRKNNTGTLKSTQRDLETRLDYDRAREVEDYINHSIISLVACVLMITGVFLTVMTYNLWSSRKRYQDSLKSQNVEKKLNLHCGSF